MPFLLTYIDFGTLLEQDSFSHRMQGRTKTFLSRTSANLPNKQKQYEIIKKQIFADD